MNSAKGASGWRSLLCGWCCQRNEEVEVLRTVSLNGRHDKTLVSNEVVTSKYSKWNFLPKNLWEQFHKASNIYFLFLMILQCIPSISTTGGKPSLALPLSVVLIANGAKDAWEDIKRHRTDKQVNSYLTHYIPANWDGPENPEESGDESTESTESEGFDAVERAVEADRCRMLSLVPQDQSTVERQEGGATASPEFPKTSSDHSLMLHQRLSNRRSSQVPHTDQNPHRDVAELEYGGSPLSFNQEPLHLRVPAARQQEMGPGKVADNAKLEYIHDPVSLLPSKPWKDVEVGDLVVCSNKEVFPADLVVLGTSDANGVLFVETSSLDGETNLKLRQSNAAVAEYLSNKWMEAWTKASRMLGTIECQPPDMNLAAYEGVLRISEPDLRPSEKTGNVQPTGASAAAQEVTKQQGFSLGPSQLLLRGCKLRNTEWCVGVVVYTGKQTKIQMNSAPPPRKTSQVEIMTNYFTLLMFLIQTAVCLVGAIVTGCVASADKYQRLGYLGIPAKSPASVAIQRFFTWIVLFGNFIPISLIVTMGMVKAFQAFFIALDEDMFDPVTNSYACARTSDLNEDLGQVRYIFSDKTGTLTCNRMEFRKCSIRGISYGEGLTEIRRSILKKQGKPVPPEPQRGANEPDTPNVNFVCEAMWKTLLDPTHSEHRHVVDFFLHLAVNHAVVAEKAEDGSVTFSASSPDEGALTYAAKHFGVEFIDRDPQGLFVSVLGELYRADILANVEFTSSRKRSSMLCCIKPADGGESSKRYLVFCKGADSVILPRIAKAGAAEAAMQDHMEAYARDGLRTLCIAKRTLSRGQVDDWFAKFQAASLAMEDRQMKVEQTVELIESDLELQGVTGIEDRLQDGVGDALESLLRAGIRVWILTGDKVETAINIGVATSLLSPDMDQVVLQWDRLSSEENNTEADKIRALREAIEAHEKEWLGLVPETHRHLVTDIKGSKAWWKKFRQTSEDNQCQPRGNAAVVIDGECLTVVLQADLKDSFVRLCRMASVVICCRVAPSQKGAVVKMVKESEDAVTLAIGDGANDCNMIQAAHVGVGLRGAEGLQAFNVSDYGLSQFSHLKILLLCHGRWCYRRVAKLVPYMFYKNIVLVLPIFFFGFISLFSGQKMYAELLYQLYNVVLTSIPIVIFGVFDIDVDKRTSLAFPELYKIGMQRTYFNAKVFLGWVLNGVFHSIVVFGLPFGALGGTQVANSKGHTADIFVVGQVCFMAVILVVNVKVLLQTAYLTFMTWIGVALSIAAFFLFLLAFSMLPQYAGDTLGVFHRAVKMPMVYILAIAVPSICLSRDGFWKALRTTFTPDVVHQLQLAKAGLREIALKKAPSAVPATVGVVEPNTFNLAVPHLDHRRGSDVSRLTVQSGDAVSVSMISSRTAGEGAVPRRDESESENPSRRGYAFCEADTELIKKMHAASSVLL